MFIPKQAFEGKFSASREKTFKLSVKSETCCSLTRKKAPRLVVRSMLCTKCFFGLAALFSLLDFSENYLEESGLRVEITTTISC